MRSVYLILDNIRSAHNVGSILRTADAAGVTQVYLCGCTPTPVDRFGRKRSDIAKVALGAEETVVWKYCEESRKLILELQNEGVFVVAVEQDKRSIPHTQLSTGNPTAFVLGEETQGIQDEILKLCDTIVEIPMAGKKESLNVSVAAGIVLFRFIEQSP